MKVLVACLCIPAVVGFPASINTENTHAASVTSSSSSTNTKREVSSGRWRPIYPSHSTTFRVIKVSPTYSETSSTLDEINGIPANTLSRFEPPPISTKEARLLHYYADSPDIHIPPLVYKLLHKPPFFKTVDHGKLMLDLQERRKKAGLPPHVLKSFRPYFPFFSY